MKDNIDDDIISRYINHQWHALPLKGLQEELGKSEGGEGRFTREN